MVNEALSAAAHGGSTLYTLYTCIHKVNTGVKIILEKYNYYIEIMVQKQLLCQTGWKLELEDEDAEIFVEVGK